MFCQCTHIAIYGNVRFLGMLLGVIVILMKNSTKIVIAVVVVLVIVVGAYLFRHAAGTDVTGIIGDQAATTTVMSSQAVSGSGMSSSTPLSTRPGWKRFDDAMYGFTFEYPATWNIATGIAQNKLGTTHIISVSSDAARAGDTQEALTFTATPVSDTGITDVIEYSSARGGFVDVSTDPVTCIPASYALGAHDVATKVPSYVLDEASVGSGTMTEQAVLTNKKAMINIREVSTYPGNTDVAGVLASLQFTGDTSPVVASCKPSALTGSDIPGGANRANATNKELIVQVTTPGTGEAWASGSSHRITWRTSSSPLSGSIAFELVNRVNRRSCLLGTAVAAAQAMNVTVTANQICANTSTMVLQPGDYDLYMRYPYTNVDPKQQETGVLYSDPANLPIHITVSDAR